ncbi:Lipoprotein signal peptidase [Frankliniella fusca]|uniref:Lipoprotein signal peptidase n=1 Tax=Frankliniella fusca TaxID=407009 RepID=A0AAE1H382_9NEOP|nr:Lipoprotein signal peptidase [Frankliniella fusca]
MPYQTALFGQQMAYPQIVESPGLSTSSDISSQKHESMSKPPKGGCGSRQAQGFYPLWQPTASVFHGNRRFADCDPIAQFDRFDPRTTIGLPLEVRAVSRALDFLIPVSEALPQRGTRDSNPQPRVPTHSQNWKRPNAQSHRANGGLKCGSSGAVVGGSPGDLACNCVFIGIRDT